MELKTTVDLTPQDLALLEDSDVDALSLTLIDARRFRRLLASHKVPLPRHHPLSVPSLSLPASESVSQPSLWFPRGRPPLQGPKPWMAGWLA